MAKKNETANPAASNADAGDDVKRNAIAKKFVMRRQHSGAAADSDVVSTRVFGEAEVVRFDFANGETRLVDPAEFSDEVRNCFTLYGVMQKFGDAYALNKDEVAAAVAEGKSKVEAAIDAFDAMLEMLSTGAWAAESKASGPRTGDVVAAWERAAIANGLEGAALEQKRGIVAAALKTGDAKVGDGTAKAYREYVLGNPKVAQALAEIKAERAAERAREAAKKAGEEQDSDAALF